MAAILMSSTEFAQQMEEAGIPRAQADIIAKGLATMVVHNFDALVTKDYLDTRFGEYEARLGREADRRFADVGQRFAAMQSQMDQRFSAMQSQMDQRFSAMQSQMDQCFLEMQSQMDQRFLAMQSRMDQRFTEQDNHMQLGFAEVNTRFARVNVMLAVIMAGVAVPVVQSLVSLLGK